MLRKLFASAMIIAPANSRRPHSLRQLRLPEGHAITRRGSKPRPLLVESVDDLYRIHLAEVRRLPSPPASRTPPIPRPVRMIDAHQGMQPMRLVEQIVRGKPALCHTVVEKTQRPPDIRMPLYRRHFFARNQQH